MALTTVSAGNVVKQWSKKFFVEYVRESRFASEMGDDQNKVIQMVHDLEKLPGETVSVPLVRKLLGNGVTGNTSLEGNEDSLINYDHNITVEVLRNGIAVTMKSEQQTQLDLLNVGRVQLKKWAMSRLRDDIIKALMSPVVDGVTAYSAATETEKNAWLSSNLDRVLFGDVLSTTLPAVHSTALATIANTETLRTTNLSKAKRIAKTLANNAITPVMVEGGSEWFVLYANSRAFRDFRAETGAFAGFLKDGWERGKNNPLFKDGDLLFDGVIIKEIPEIPVIAGVGAGGVDVVPCFLCGAQAVGVAWAQPTTPIFETRDYGFVNGVGVSEHRGVSKLMFNRIQNGVVTMYVAGAAD